MILWLGDRRTVKSIHFWYQTFSKTASLSSLKPNFIDTTCTMLCSYFLSLFLGISTQEEFVYDIEFESDRVASQLKSAVAINLLKKFRDLKTRIVTLIFNIIFAPSKPMRYSAQL